MSSLTNSDALNYLTADPSFASAVMAPFRTRNELRDSRGKGLANVLLVPSQGGYLISLFKHAGLLYRETTFVQEIQYCTDGWDITQFARPT